jgi:hypothetical protein
MRKAALDKFASWIDEHHHGTKLRVALATDNMVIEYLHHVATVLREPKAALNAFTHIDAERGLRAVPALRPTRQGRALADAISNLTLPAVRIRQPEALFDVARVIAHAARAIIPTEPTHAQWLALTRRALVLTRAVTMIRSCDAAGILRSTVRQTKHPWGDRQVVVFEYVPKGKGAPQSRSRKLGIIEFMPASLRGRCAAATLLAYKQMVDEAVGNRHDAMFVGSKQPHAPLSRDRLRTLVDSVLSELGIAATAHSLRMMTRDKLLKFHDEPGEVDGALWANANVAVQHYQSGFRRPEVNFSLAASSSFEILSDAKQRCGNIFEQNILQSLDAARARAPRVAVYVTDTDSESS